MNSKQKYNKIGRKLYYLKATGEVLYDSGEMEGFVLPTTYEQDIRNAGLEGIPEEDIGVLELKHGDYKAHFKQYGFFKVNLTANKLHFYNKEIYRMNPYNDQAVKKEYTEEKLYEFYNTYIDFNLPRAMLLKNVKFNWKTVDELGIRVKILDRSWVTYFKDQYLAESARDKTKLALDMLENGTYWPIVTAYDPNDGQLYVYEGNHRVISAKLALIDGTWPKDKKFLCMELSGIYQDYKAVEAQMPLDQPLLQKFPFAALYDTRAYEDKDIYANVLDQIKDDGADFVDEDKEIIQKQVYTYTEFMHANQTFPHWLRDIFFKFKEENGRIIKPDPRMYNEDAWNEWVSNLPPIDDSDIVNDMKKDKEERDSDKVKGEK